MRKLVCVVALVVVWVGVFVASLNTPLMCDDNTYALEYNHGSERGERFVGENCDFPTITGKVANLASIFVYHYTHENGRFSTAIPLRLFAGIPHWCYAVLNATMFILLSYFVFLLSGLNRRCFLAVVGLTVFCLLKTDAVLWMAAAINYLWPMVLIMACVLVFRRAGNWRMLHALWCAPFAFVAAGGHEIMSVPICFLLAVYWIGLWWKQRKFFVNVPLLMTFAFGLGSLVIFMSPVSPLFRAGYETSSSFAYLLLCKVMTLAFVFVGSPVLIIVLALLTFAICKHQYRAVVYSTNGFWILLLAIGMVFTIAFGTIGARASWPMNVLSLLVFLKLAPCFLLCRESSRIRVVSFLCVMLGLGVLLNTALASVMNGKAYDRSFSEYKTNDDNVYLIPQRADWLLGFLFDRTHDPRNVVQIAQGEACTNGNLSRRLARPCIIGLFESDYRWLKEISDVARLPCHFAEGAWHGDDIHDLLVQELIVSNQIDCAASWSGVVEYAPSSRFSVSDFLNILRSEAAKNFGGPGVFRTQVFFEQFARDVIYATLYKSNPLKGFYIRNGRKVYKVLVHNHFADRKQIVGVR